MSNLSNVKNFIGVDISKDTLDICVLNYKLAKITKTILKIYNAKIKAFLEILIKNRS